MLEEAHDAFEPSIVHHLYSNTPKDLEDNVDKIVQWVQEWKGVNDYIMS